MTKKKTQENLPGFDKACAEASQRDISPETREAFLIRKREQWKKYMEKAKEADKARYAVEIKKLTDLINANGK